MNLISTRYSGKATLLVFLFVLAAIAQVHATHLRAGEITVVRDNCNSLKFWITITVYTNTKNTNVLFGGDQDVLDFGDGSPSVLVPETPNTVRTDLNPDGSVATASYTITHTYAGPGKYLVSYREPNRNEGVLNMDASVNTTFYIETLINVDPFLGCNNTPNLLIPPIDRACPGVAWFHNPGAYDPDGDSLSYKMVVPYSDKKTEVVNYRDPNTGKFYTNFNTANEDANGPPTFSIDPVTGTLTWDAPGAVGEYNVAFHIIEWRKIGNTWYNIGYVRRDMQILVEDCKNQRPDLIMPEDVCVEAGTTLEATIFGIDPDNDKVKIEAFSEIFNFPPAQSPATYSPVPRVGDYLPSSPPYETKFTWNTECVHVKEQPYQVVFKITDSPTNGPKLVTFKTWFIKVVGPAPIWQSAELDLGQRKTTLKWDSYFCQNAETIQVWRKVDGVDFTPANCQTGMPENLGYQLIKTLPVRSGSTPTTGYVDDNGGKGLAPGAKYCYRLVAIFPLPRGGESYVSKDTCVGPILADVPIITNVSVEETDPANGRMLVKWREPFDVDPVQFPPPYQYVVYRATGFTRGSDSVKVSPDNFTSLSFTDIGLNTEVDVYNYSIAAYDAANKFVGTSAVASSVRLETQSQVKRIELTWSAEVPWSNTVSTFPSKHVIYRGPEGATEDQMVLIDSVDVSTTGFTYVDEGQYNGVPLEDNQVYCYRVETKGGYGNPKIKEPFRNFSQTICAQPGDTIPPCKPFAPIAAEPQNCDTYISSTETCNNNIFSNKLKWERGDNECENDISYYLIYVSSSFNGEFTALPVKVFGTEYEDINLPSFARCYKIAAVDRSGNISEQSEAICFDNCPYYELPNVFSPNGDRCNDIFSAYSDRDLIGENGEEQQCVTPELNKARCARFVEKVLFRVYNRWGREVYTYSSGGERTIYIDWDGRGTEGGELSTGVYYYIAEVTFSTIEPSNRNKTIKGWVHLIR